MILINEKRKILLRRYYAAFFDYLMILILIVVYIFVFGEQDAFGNSSVRGLSVLIIPLIWILYFPACETIFGQTIGKRFFNLFVSDFKGRHPTIVQAFLRRILDPFDLIFLGIPFLLFVNHSDKHQRIGDFLAGTTVISTDGHCKFCQSDLELTLREAVSQTFICPHCKQIN